MKKIIAFLKKYQLIIFLALIASLLFGLKLTIPSEQTPNLPTPTPIPLSPTPEPETPSLGEGKGMTEKELIEELAGKYPLTAFLPYPDKRVKILYVKEVTLEISIDPSSNITQKEILNWINDQGIDPKSHQIIWK